MRNRSVARLILVFAALMATAMIAPNGRSAPEPPDGPSRALVWSKQIDGFVFESRWNDTWDGQVLEASFNGRLCFEFRGFRFELGAPTRDHEGWSMTATPDHLDSNECARVLIHETFGSATVDNSRIYVIDLSRTLTDGHATIAQVIRAPFGSIWSDLDKDGDLECKLNDGSFRGWCADNARSVMPQVVLDDRGDGYSYAPDLMLQPAPTWREFDALVNPEPEWMIECGFRAPWAMQECPELEHISNVVQLIYSGNADVAWAYYELVRSDLEPTVDDFKASIEDRIEGSPYWIAVTAVNELGLMRNNHDLDYDAAQPVRQGGQHGPWDDR